MDEYKVLLERIIENREITTVYQPIASLKDGTVIGYEALSRGPKDSLLERPDMLFEAASKYGCVWDLEALCRTKALESLSGKKAEKTLVFINVDPSVMKDEKFKSGFTKEVLMKYNINPESIIFEVTEKTAIEDYKIFKKTLENYVRQGYKIAIDDTGSGHSGLSMLANVYPNYVKIDMELVRNVDKDVLKQTLLRAFVDFSHASGIKIIAEGIETVNELNTLIDIGVQYGQGYFLQRPSANLLDINKWAYESIIRRNIANNKLSSSAGTSLPIGEIARCDATIHPQAPGKDVYDLFHNTNIQGLPVVEEGRVCGLIMKTSFFSHLATQYGMAVFMNRPIKLLMDKQPLVVDYNTPISQVAGIAMSRKEDNLYDYIIVSRDNCYYGIITVKSLLDKINQIELNRARNLNPLTQLPGNKMIIGKMQEIIDSGMNFTAMYVDIDNFKAYNDTYGFANGDKVIKMVGAILEYVTMSIPDGNAFVGHIGGDDFIVIVPGLNYFNELAKRIIEEFDIKSRDYYNETDQRKGFVVLKDRRSSGVDRAYDLMSISIGAVAANGSSFRSPEEISEVLRKSKAKSKEIRGSSFFYMECL
ncbi:MAG: EAL domain/GGDEF domain protein [Firmicutes bacterium]|nr:EAL domain/GGDEF domain protein [Bacillota bacterium]MDI6706906.1 GGDEF domain-containing protein [Bacillota bacterium]